MQKALKPLKTPRPRGPVGPPRQLTQDNYQVLAEFRYALLKFLAFSEAAAKEAGLSPKQHQALLAIKGSDGSLMSVQQLADRLIIQHNSAVELVDRLVESKLVTRVRDPRDGRRAQIGLTPKAEQLLLALSAAHFKELRTIRPIFLTMLGQLE
jgi:DNA-binding MarR family transcriptional regulator